MRYGTKLDFTGQQIYVGLDIHKKSWSVSIYSEHSEHKTFTQPPAVDKLVYYLRRHFPGATYHSVYEAGYSGFWIHDRLQEHGVQCLVVNPADVPTKDKERTKKTDRVDCRKLARSLRPQRSSKFHRVWPFNFHRPILTWEGKETTFPDAPGSII